MFVVPPVAEKHKIVSGVDVGGIVIAFAAAAAAGDGDDDDDADDATTR